MERTRFDSIACLAPQLANSPARLHENRVRCLQQLQSQPAADLNRAAGFRKARQGRGLATRYARSVIAYSVQRQIGQGKPLGTKSPKCDNASLHQSDIVPPETLGRRAEPVEQGNAAAIWSRTGQACCPTCRYLSTDRTFDFRLESVQEALLQKS